MDLAGLVVERVMKPYSLPITRRQLRCSAHALRRYRERIGGSPDDQTLREKIELRSLLAWLVLPPNFYCHHGVIFVIEGDVIVTCYNATAEKFREALWKRLFPDKPE